MQENIEKKRLIFQIKAFELVEVNFSYYHGILASAVNRLTNSPKIPDLTKRDVF